ncbi:unnamed protein product [Penicillium salamii]|nr:unnamed protein product [Penicillium salamii]CAG8229147.1 unnamed protein product [Penicillium salamii]CAG8247295.1 unnamed protein product [Penicillium salamii]CAG8304995.1 unnamed protein product [Penicillium salamii]CAG8324727.1 unnamed protein product [Penicillium salamii]
MSVEHHHHMFAPASSLRPRLWKAPAPVRWLFLCQPLFTSHLSSFSFLLSQELGIIMRYRNWDVLLFPGGGRVPVSEFKTQCFVAKDIDAPYLQAINLGPHGYQGSVMFNQLPVLTTFIPSLPVDSTFQISIHSWETPRPSAKFESNMGPEDTVMFEARVYIDGIFSSGSLYGQRTPWPQIMNPDREGNQDNLRFPPFHREILQQRAWDAADFYGRIKVVLAEGVSRPNRTPPFERYRDFLVFSFQHAPLNVLENAEIAWPNPKLWLPVPTAPRYTPATASYGSAKEYDDHGHSPVRPGRLEKAVVMPVNPSSQSSSDTTTFSGGSLSAYNAWAPHGGFPIPVTQWNEYPQGPRWEPQDTHFAEAGMESIFEDIAWRQRGARSSREDIAMPDYSSNASSSRPLSTLTGYSYEHSNPSIPDYLTDRHNRSINVHLDDDQHYNELIQSLTPTKAAPSLGTCAPSNTPSESMPPPKLSAAALARSARYTRSRRTSILADSSQSSTREVSGSSQSLAPEKALMKEVRKDTRRRTSQEVSKEPLKKAGLASTNEHIMSDRETRAAKRSDKATHKITPESLEDIDQENLEQNARDIAKQVEDLIAEGLQEGMVAGS